MTAGGIHGVTTSIDQTGVTAGNVATSIEGHRTKAVNQALTLAGNWEGEAKRKFDVAFENWQTGVQRVVVSLTELGENVRFSARTYEAQDMDSASSFNGLTTT